VLEASTKSEGRRERDRRRGRVGRLGLFELLLQLVHLCLDTGERVLDRVLARYVEFLLLLLGASGEARTALPS